MCLQIVHDNARTVVTKIDTCSMPFRHKWRLENWDQLSSPNLPKLTGICAYTCDPVVYWVVHNIFDTLCASHHPDIITICLKWHRESDQSPNQTYNIHYLSVLTLEKVEISTGEPNHKAAGITTRPRYSRSCAIERVFSHKQLLPGCNRPNDDLRIVT